MSRRDLENLFVDPDDVKVISQDSTHFDTLAHASRALEGSAFSEFELRAAQAGIFARLDAQEPGDLNHVITAPAANSNRRTFLMALGAVALALLLIPFATHDDRETSDWQARSAQSPRVQNLPKVHVYCMRKDGDSLNFIGENESPFGVITCRPSDDLKIAYENPDPSLKFAHFVGLSTTGETLWYGPTPHDSAPFAVGITHEPTPLGETKRLAVNHSAGRYDVLGLFTQRPLAFSEFKTMVEHLKISDDRSGVFPGVVLVHAEFEVKP